MNFYIKCEKTRYVFSLNKHKSQLLIDADTRDYIIFIECINVNEWNILFMLIVTKKRIFHKWILKNNFNDDVLFIINDIEYFNDELTFKWLKHFNLHIKEKMIKF